MSLEISNPNDYTTCSQCNGTIVGERASSMVKVVSTISGVSYYYHQSCHQLNASVAQPAEQVPRKDEVAGSTPVASSKGFNHEQRELMATVVCQRVAMEEQRTAIRQDKNKMEKFKSEHAEDMRKLQTHIASCEAQYAYHEVKMILAEQDLRASILDGVTVGQTATIQTLPPPQIEEMEELGRAD